MSSTQTEASTKKYMLMLATTASMIEQFNKNNILILKSMGYEVHVAGNFLEGNPVSDERLEEFKQWLGEHGAKWFQISATRKPYDVCGNGKALKDILALINTYHYHFIHCHTPIGSVLGRIAAHKTHTKIIYTAHGFHFYKGAPLKNWMLYYPVEKFLSRWTDVLITINQEDYERAKMFKARKLEHIHGVGVDTNVFKLIDRKASREEIRKEFNIPKDATVVLSVGELNKNKNHRIIIEELKLYKDVWYIICGKGPLANEYLELAKRLNMSDRLILTGYRPDVKKFYCAADVFAFPSKREGLSLAVMEAMSYGLPIIASDIRGNSELIDVNGGCRFDFRDQNDLHDKMNKFLDMKDKWESMGNYNQHKVSAYNLDEVEKEMKKIYTAIDVQDICR